MTFHKTEAPVLFSGPMVRKILSGEKTQTRRVISLPTKRGVRDSVGWRPFDPSLAIDRGSMVHYSPYSAEALWVRETWRTAWREEVRMSGPDGIRYRADDAWVGIENTMEASAAWVEAYANGKHGTDWRPSIFCKRWMSRITLHGITIRVERLNEISEADAAAEGAERPGNGQSYRDGFLLLWQSINGKRPGCAWADNPWVWRVEWHRREVRT